MADFDDLLAANRRYAAETDTDGLAARAAAGVLVLTCMDSRIDPLALLGLRLGDAKVFRNPGGRVTPQALEAVVLGVHLLEVDRVLVVPHTRCAIASASEAELQQRVGESAGVDASGHRFDVIDDQLAELRAGVEAIRSHPLVPDGVRVGGFLYDVDTGLLEPQA